MPKFKNMFDVLFRLCSALLKEFPDNKISVIKVVKNVTGMGLTDSKKWVEFAAACGANPDFDLEKFFETYEQIGPLYAELKHFKSETLGAENVEW